jgi:hypothetical protein
VTSDLRYGYLLEFRLTGYGWHQRSEFNASYSTYRFFSGLQVLHAVSRFEQLLNIPSAPYRPAERWAELQRHEIETLGVPAGRRWASPAVPISVEPLAVDRQVYNSRPEPVVGWPRQAVFPTWGTLELMRPFSPEQEGGSAYHFQSLYLAEHEHDLRVGDVYWIGKKRVMIQIVQVESSAVTWAKEGQRDSVIYLEIPLANLSIFDSYHLYDATGRGQVVAAGHFTGPAVTCGRAAVPERLLEPYSVQR